MACFDGDEVDVHEGSGNDPAKVDREEEEADPPGRVADASYDGLVKSLDNGRLYICREDELA